ncbi:hypothetical protein HW115_19185 [Verrucomicrobiaceae bacterium N1E253]|uniref:Uncharacterized protein n=1 Tax=Oceaniferula marina TaxID=2748318 RepID=A0A851GPC9_9BACT|nr:hypothetical protein [Oceaniferula marina]NWK57751.1 hypothetical protein [Oceaniferula marina]
MWRLAIITIFLLLGCNKEGGKDHSRKLSPEEAKAALNQLVLVEVSGSLVITDNRVKISIADNGDFKLERQNLNDESRSSTGTISPSNYESLKLRLAQVRWDLVSQDDVRGLDGRMVRLIYADRAYLVWSPSYDQDVRGLDSLIDILNETYRLVGLDSFSELEK